jgi:hypothetical protein
VVLRIPARVEPASGYGDRRNLRPSAFGIGERLLPPCRNRAARLACALLQGIETRA